jgi:outer membrane lipoprotein LolB
VWNLEPVNTRAGVGLAWLAGLAVLVLAAGGCATVKPSAANEGWTSGRLSVRIEASPERIAQSLSAAFELRADAPGRSGELRLSSPLGTRMATAIWAPDVARLITPEGEQRFSSLDDLSRQSLGENLPLAALPSWLVGRPWPEAPHQVSSEGFVQLGWQVSLARKTEGWIEARRSSPAPAVLVRVRLDDAP